MPDTTPTPRIPSGAHAIAALGARCEALVEERFAKGELLSLIGSSEDLRIIGEALQGWNDEQAFHAVSAYFETADAGRVIDANSIRRWALSRPDDAEALIDCMKVDPPNEITILKLLSRAGSQKLVFLASWELAQRQVVLKKLLVDAELATEILRRESQAHPLSMKNRNIIETHLVKNDAGEVFLVEEKLPVILSDTWQADGVEDGANLLHDIASALAFLHINLKKIHGDIKPDNIGHRGKDYILLDFGICRPIAEFTPETTGTGSLRTRAPELLTKDTYDHPMAGDIWALGATVFNAFVKRFPLFHDGEAPPRVSHPEERGVFEDELAERVRSRYDELVDVDLLPEPMRHVIGRCLARNPSLRPSAPELLELCQERLGAYVRSDEVDSERLSPMEELNQYREFLFDHVSPTDIPVWKRQQLKERIEQLGEFPGVTQENRAIVNSLLQRLAA